MRRNLRLELGGVVVFLVLSLFLSVSLPAQTSEVFSPATADAFLQTAVDLYTDPNAEPAQARQAMAFLEAIANLNESSEYILPDVVKVAWKFPQVDFSKPVAEMIRQYAVNEKADLDVTRLAIQYVAGKLNTREEREHYYSRLLQNIDQNNDPLSSEIATQLGLLCAERADMQGAQNYFMLAYKYDPYNKLAFAKLGEISSQPLPLDFYLYHLRLMMNVNPYDIDAAFAFARGAYQAGLYPISANAFAYCADLFKQLHPGDKLPFVIYKPWALACLNDPKRLSECIAIEQTVRSAGGLDLYLEAIAANAAQKAGNADQASQIISSAAQKAEAGSSQVKPQDLAWFYCFGSPSPERALEWANKANAAEGNSPDVSAVLAYALVMNGQNDAARPVAQAIAANNQIAALALGQIQLAVDPNAAVETLKKAVAMDPGTLESQQAKLLLEQKGSTYIAPAGIEALTKALQSEFGEQVVDKFAPAEKIISAKLQASGTDFSYGSALTINLVINNNVSNPLIISDDGLFKGNIRIDAAVTGDIKERMPNLLTLKIKPAKPIIANSPFFVPLRIMTGRLRQIMFSHPQAKLQVEFTAYLDPVTDPNGTVRSSLPGVGPVRLAVSQKPVNISTAYLQNRLNSLAHGVSGQKVKTAQLFAGLLREEQVTGRTGIDPALLRSAIVRCLNDEDWQVKVQTTLMLSDIPLTYELQDAVGLNLTNSFWPVRMTSLWLLGEKPTEQFKKVLDWTVLNDSSEHVVDMAVALGATPPKPKPLPAEPNNPVMGKSAVPEANAPARAVKPPAGSNPLSRPAEPNAANKSPSAANPAPVTPAAQPAAEPNTAVAPAQPNTAAPSVPEPNAVAAEPNKPSEPAKEQVSEPNGSELTKTAEPNAAP